MRHARACILFCALPACSNDYDALGGASATGSAASSGGAAQGAGGGAAASSGAGGSGGAASSASSAAAGGGGGKIELALPIYFTSKTSLWEYHPDTKERTLVLEYSDVCDDIVDIAVDGAGIFYANSFSGALYRVNPDGTCIELHSQGRGYYTPSLGYLTDGIRGGEALIGYDNANYVRIDILGGTKRNVGGLGQRYPHGLDVVVVDAQRGWAIVGAGGDCSHHCLVRIDPILGAAIPPALSFGVEEMYGVAWSLGVAYGFHFDGRVFEVDLATSNIDEVPKGDNDDYGDGVWGAASPPAPSAAR